jgi:hypothetical protein
MEFRFAERLSAVGARHDVHWLIYNPFQFRWFHQQAKGNAPGVVDALREVFPDARSVVDVGAGAGTFAARARRSGLRAQAFEYGYFGRVYAAAQRVRSRKIDFGAPLPERPEADLAWSFEVAEHLPPAMGDRLVEFLSGFPQVAFTASPPGQGGVGHIHLQPKEFWIERFAAHGMRHDPDRSERLRAAFGRRDVAFWFPQNALVFERT